VDEAMGDVILHLARSCIKVLAWLGLILGGLAWVMHGWTALLCSF
jgi:hypothetical protein